MRIETFYTPRNVLYGLMNAALMRRQFRKVVDQLLAGLVAYAATHDAGDHGGADG